MLITVMAAGHGATVTGQESRWPQCRLRASGLGLEGGRAYARIRS